MSKPKVFEALEKRGLVPRGDRWDGKCPAHDDDKKSLVVGIGDNGSVLLTCHAGCTVREIVEALELKMTDLWHDVPGGKKWAPPQDVQASVFGEEYNYRDESQAVLYQVQRFIPKSFRQRRLMRSAVEPRSTWWEYELGDVRRVLYGLPELNAQPNRPCFIVEGEKDVHSLRQLGFLATTVAGGARGWAKHAKNYAEQFGNRECIILPDNDDPGRQFAADIRATLPHALVVTLPVAEKGDVTDLVEKGWNVNDVEKWVHDTAWIAAGVAKRTLDRLTLHL